ncbi:retinoschisin-like [Montipora foliosa]
MEFGEIKDAQIQASSEYDLNHAAIQGRLNFQKSGEKRGAWAAKYSDSNQWLQIDLQGSYTKVTAVASQGRNDFDLWVTKYKLQYSNDGVTFRYFREEGQTVDKEFAANNDKNSIIYHKLNPPIMARYVRFRPVTWHNHISMRVEVYGCKQGPPDPVH